MHITNYTVFVIYLYVWTWLSIVNAVLVSVLDAPKGKVVHQGKVYTGARS